MRCDCHMHMILDGKDWKAAIARHADRADLSFIQACLAAYRDAGYTYLRDGGDRWGAGKAARDLAPAYGIRYRTPLAPLCMDGHYGGFIGRRFSHIRQYHQLVLEQKQQGADFIKIMISGLMDFDYFGTLSEEPLPPALIHQMIHIAHEEGMAVMAHANGARTVQAAAEAGVDSIEHGAYLDEAALSAMAASGTVWVPTLSAIGNLLHTGRFDDNAVQKILDSALTNISTFAAMGGLLAQGSDAGAWAVPHGSLSELHWLQQALGKNTDAMIEKGNARIREIF